MSAKSILRKIKQVFGLSPAGGAETEPPDDGGAEVTIEREPDHEVTDTAADAGPEGAADAAGSADTGGDPAEEAADESTSESTEEAADELEATADDAADEPAPGDESTDAIKGIGPTYSDRLAEAGIDTVADLADATPETVADAAKTGESKAMSWIDRANEYLS